MRSSWSAHGGYYSCKEDRLPLRLAVYLGSVDRVVLVMQARKMKESGGHGDMYRDSRKPPRTVNMWQGSITNMEAPRGCAVTLSR